MDPSRGHTGVTERVGFRPVAGPWAGKAAAGPGRPLQSSVSARDPIHRTGRPIKEGGDFLALPQQEILADHG